jgi:hypothetical protein
MKFGEHLRSQKVEAWAYAYLDYDKLKNMIKELEEQHLSQFSDMGTKGSMIYSRCCTLRIYFYHLPLSFQQELR